ncbi:MAG: type II toxin-antitoxin system ParD family antitoxin [Sphingomonas sp.]|nr:type II toxin-antitoxin system ParD family antitoxin [Sphingomonas sp.]
MTHITITMPPALQHWIEARLAEGHYADAADYLRDLVRRDRQAADTDHHRLRGLIEEGLASGILPDEPEDVLKEIMARLPNA